MCTALKSLLLAVLVISVAYSKHHEVEFKNTEIFVEKGDSIRVNLHSFQQEGISKGYRNCKTERINNYVHKNSETSYATGTKVTTPETFEFSNAQSSGYLECESFYSNESQDKYFENKIKLNIIVVFP